MSEEYDIDEITSIDWFAAKALPVVAAMNNDVITEYAQHVLSSTKNAGEIADSHEIFLARAHGIAYYAYEMAEAMLTARKVFLEDK